MRSRLFYWVTHGHILFLGSFLLFLCFLPLFSLPTACFCFLICYIFLHYFFLFFHNWLICFVCWLLLSFIRVSFWFIPFPLIASYEYPEFQALVFSYENPLHLFSLTVLTRAPFWFYFWVVNWYTKEGISVILTFVWPFNSLFTSQRETWNF